MHEETDFPSSSLRFDNYERPKRIKFSHPYLDIEEEEIGTSEESSSLGLSLKKSASLIDLVEKRLSEGRRVTKSNSNSNSNTSTTKVDCNCDNHNNNKKPMSEDYGSQPMSEKLKASNFPAFLLKIGKWERISKHEGDLVAKCYYAKKKLVWEILDGALKTKIEIQWNDIIGIRATIAEDQPGILEIELNQPPSFFRETNPQPRKHTLWQQANDFTGTQALKYRIHYVRFAPGILDKHYEKLLQCYPRLLALSQRPFPSLPSPYFETNTQNLYELTNDFLLEGYGGATYLTKLPHQYPMSNCTPLSLSTVSNLQLSGVMAENGIAYWEESHHIQTPAIFPSTQLAGFSSQLTHAIPYEGMGIPNAAGSLHYNQTCFDENLVSQQMDESQHQMEERQLIQHNHHVSSSIPSAHISSHVGVAPMNWELDEDIMMQQPTFIYNNPTKMNMSPYHQCSQGIHNNQCQGHLCAYNYDNHNM